ncbi:hypothetical protein [Aestuariivirga sp.]|uniref:hypothetical protein n=1 Tax=Aestuariivirga sp. TaxID=2650926 RepID=UPI0039E6D995
MADFPSDEEIRARENLLREIADELISTGVISDKGVIFRSNLLKSVAESYFLLNDAYKRWRIVDGHRTHPAKAAALTCLVIARLQPFLPRDPNNARTLQQARANEIYALACAGVFLGTDLKGHRIDVYLRLTDVLAAYSCETIEPYIVDRSVDNNRELSTYELKILEQDKLPINTLITIFEFASEPQNIIKKKKRLPTKTSTASKKVKKSKTAKKAKKAPSKIKATKKGAKR